MTDQDLLIEIDSDDTEGHGTRIRITSEDDDWAPVAPTGSGPRRILLKATDDDVEGHAMGSTIRIRAYDDDDDTEGHAVSVHFPTWDEADAFRRRLMLTGVLAGTVVLGTAAGVGLANLGSGDAARTAAGASSAAGMDWTQAERPVQGAATGAGAGAGMDWTQAERPIQGAVTGAGAGADADDANAPGTGGPTPR